MSTVHILPEHITVLLELGKSDLKTIEIVSRMYSINDERQKRSLEKNVTRYITSINKICFKVFNYELIVKQKGRWHLSNPNILESEWFNLAKVSCANSTLFGLLEKYDGLTNRIIIDTLGNLNLAHLDIALFSIKNKNLVKLKYQGYSNEPETEITVKPCLIITYLNRWYLIAVTDKEEHRKGKNFSFDRIKSIEIIDDHFEVDNLDEIKLNYREVVGVTHYYGVHEAPVEDVTIRFYENQFKYFLADPWVTKDRIVEIAENGKTVDLTISVRENNELHQRILINNEKVEVIKPVHLRKRIKEILQNTMCRYE